MDNAAACSPHKGKSFHICRVECGGNAHYDSFTVLHTPPSWTQLAAGLARKVPLKYITVTWTVSSSYEK